MNSSASLSATSPTLLRLAASGDARAWERLVSLYGPLVFYWIQRQGLREQDAADIMQDVFTSVARSLRRFQLRESGRFRGWLWVMTRNQMVDYFRQQGRQAIAVGGTAAWEKLAAVAQSLPAGPDEFTPQDQLTALHRRGLELVRSEFEERTWCIFCRVVIDEVPTHAVAEEFGVSSNSVRQTKSRVLRRLRQILGDQDF